MKTSRKTIFQTITVIWTFLLAPAMAIADGFLNDDLYFYFQSDSDTEVYVSRLRYISSTHVTIPSTVVYEYTEYESNGNYSVKHRTCRVTSIGHAAFRKCGGLTSVTIPNSITNIESEAFYNCSGLASVTIPGSVTSIESSAFNGCSSLGSVTIPDSVTSIDDWVFQGCSGLTNVTILGNVTNDWDYYSRPFRDCMNIESIVLGGKMTKIGDCMFYDASRVQSLAIPDSVTSIGNHAFRNCSALTDLAIGSSVTNIGGGTFRNCSGLTSLAIPDSVTYLGGDAFMDCVGLTSVTFGDSVEVFAGETFARCSNLTSLTLPDSVKSIGMGTFERCTGLTSMEIPNSVTNIGPGAFVDCTGLTNVVIGDSVTSIESSAFRGCTGLTSMKIPNSVTNIGNIAFSRCRGLGSVAIPGSVTRIGAGAFAYCSGLASVTIPVSVTSFGGGAFSFCSSLSNVVFRCGVPTVDESGSSLVFDGVPSGARGRYPSAHAAEWLAVLDADGKWQGLPMAENPVPELPSEQTVTFEANGGTCGTAVKTYEVGEAYGELPTPKWSGHVWLGWWTGPSEGERVAAESVVTAEAERTLWARWTDRQVTTFRGNGGKPAAQATTNAIYADYGTFPEAKWSGHVLVGWFTAPESGKRVYTNSTVTLAAARTLYAHWTDRQVVTFKGNGGTPTTEKTTNTMGTAYGTLPVPKWSGHVFLGWFTKAAGGTEVRAEDRTTEATARTLYAHWTDQQVTTFLGNGGTPATQATTNTIYGKYATMPTPKWSGHVFLGWFNAAEGGKRVYTNSTVTLAAARTLWAQWTDQQVTTFKGNGGMPATQATTNTIYGKYTCLPTPTWEGHSFQGWYNAKEGGKRVYTNSTVTLAAARTLYAHWTTAKGFAITAIAVGADGGDEEVAPQAVRRENKAENVCRLRFELSGGTEYEIQWTASIDGGWETVERLTADTDGEVEIEIEVPGGEKGFFRLVAFEAAGEAD